MDVRILGPLEVREDGRSLDLGGPRPRALFTILAMRLGEVVPVERLVDELWGETAPKSAHHLLHVYVSSLRKVVGDRLVTRARGYALDFDPERLDARRFESLVALGRELLAGGDSARAAQALGEALGLWRGPALVDFTYEPFAQAEIARLDELRLTALEQRIEADLGLGRDGELVGELETLVAKHPLRERFSAQLMLALYRSGRQADALAVYQNARRTLVDDLGLEPSRELQDLERAILTHDPSLRPSNAARPHAKAVDIESPASLGRRRTPAVLAVGTLVVAGAVAAAVIGFGGLDAPTKLEDAVAAIDASEGRVVAYAPVGTTPRNVAAGEGGVWVLNADDDTLSRIDPETRQIVKTIGTGGTPTELAVGGGAVWVGSRGAGARPSFSTTSILRVDPVSAVVTRRLVLPRPRSKTLLSNTILGVSQLAVGAGAVWAINPDLTVSRIDAATGELVATVTDTTVSASSGIAAGEEGVWVISEGASVTRIDPRTNRTAQKIALGSTPFLVGIAVGGGSVWTSVPEDGVVWRIEPGLQPRTRTIQVGFGVTNLAFAEGALWATNFIDGTVSRIDAAKNVVTRRIRVAGTPQGVAVGEDTVWVSVAGATTRGALPVASCGEIESGGKTPDVLIASDLPLQGPAAPVTRSMADAIRFVLREHEFRAGGFAVGYQSCDNATARSGTFDFFKCSSNARAYAQADKLVAVVGPYDSDCAQVELIVANQVSGGELAIIGPSTTYSGLTRGGAGAWASRDDPSRYYPSGTRTFIRLPTPDDLQAAGAALLARRLGLETMYVLDGGGPWGIAARRSFVAAARRLGLEIVGIGSYDVIAQSYARVAARVTRSGAQGVFLSGSVFFNGGQVVKALRARVGRDVVLIGGEGFAPVPELLRTARSSAFGMYVVAGSTPLDKLDPIGRRFARGFGATQPHGVIPPYVLEAAQAAELALQAIERSSGTRASVLGKLQTSRMKNGILGSFGVDRNGDVSPARVAIYRVTGKTPSDAEVLSGFEGATLNRIVRLAARLRSTDS